MKPETVACLSGLAVAAVFGGALLYQQMRPKTPEQEKNASSTPCRRAALARAAAQGTRGMIPLQYANAPMAAYNTNPDR